MGEAMGATIRVVDPSGSPIEGVAVTVVSGTARYPELTLLSGTDGIVRISLLPGSYRVAAICGNRHVEADVAASGEIQIALS